jgi:hypothetical protein
MTKPVSPSCERNRDPILAVLAERFSDRSNVLEIGSGTGQHAAYFAGHLTQLTWQASDCAEHLPGIGKWLDEAALSNAPAAIELDVDGTWPTSTYDAAFTANTLHIMSWPQVERTFAQLDKVLGKDAMLVVYGPFNYEGQFTSDSNAAFEDWLKDRGDHMGIRDFEAVDALARGIGLTLIDDVAMPAHNRCLVWKRPA